MSPQRATPLAAIGEDQRLGAPGVSLLLPGLLILVVVSRWSARPVVPILDVILTQTARR